MCYIVSKLSTIDEADAPITTKLQRACDDPPAAAYLFLVRSLIRAWNIRHFGSAMIRW